MSTPYTEYSVDAEIDAFFKQTSASRDACDAKAKQLVGGNIAPVDVQGACSYSVYAGPEMEFVVQCRLESLALNQAVVSLASEIYGSLAPTFSFEGKLGDGKEPLYIYLMSRVRGMTYLDFVLAHGYPADSADNVLWRKNLMGDIANFMALSWKAPQPVSSEYRSNLRGTYLNDLELLHVALPARFQPVIQTCINTIDDILALPMVLLHRDFGDCNIMVDEASCHLVGVIDWAEAEICPFGLNLHSLQCFTGKLHLRNGWTRLGDYDDLQNIFWAKFEQEVGGLAERQLQTIKLARALGLLLSQGFTSRLKNQAEPVPIADDEQGRYNMLSLDGFLIDPLTRFDGLAQC